jgi:hypothetical protein
VNRRGTDAHEKHSDESEMRRRFPLLCLGCGNAILVCLGPDELVNPRTVRLEHSACVVCDAGDPSEELQVDAHGNPLDPNGDDDERTE